MATAKITEATVKNLPINGELRDTEVKGFYVKRRQKAKVFYFSFISPITTRRRNTQVGWYGDLTVAQAREVARQMAADVAKGHDPLEQKQSAKVKAERERQSCLRVFLEGAYKESTTEGNFKTVSARIKKHFPDLLDKPMSSISAWQIEKWKRSYTGKKTGANRILTALRGVLTHAVRAGLLDAHPMADVKDLKHDKSTKIKYLSESEEKALRVALDARETEMRAGRLRNIEHKKKRRDAAPEPYGTFTDYLKPMVLVALNTGLRRGELFNLKISDIDLPAKLLTVVGEGDGTTTGSKSGQSRQVPLNDEAFSVLVAWMNQMAGNEFVFPSPVTGGRFDNINKSWSEVKKAAGLPELDFYELRHTFGTRLAHARVDLVTIKEMMGHQNLDTTALYLHTSVERKREAVALLKS